VISRRVPMLIRPAIGDTDPIRYRRPTPDGQFSGNIIDEAMRPATARWINRLACRSASGPHAGSQLLVKCALRPICTPQLLSSHTCALDFFLAGGPYDLIASDRPWFGAEA
jgi:hypothetical protein